MFMPDLMLNESARQNKKVENLIPFDFLTSKFDLQGQ